MAGDGDGPNQLPGDAPEFCGYITDPAKGLAATDCAHCGGTGKLLLLAVAGPCEACHGTGQDAPDTGEDPSWSGLADGPADAPTGTPGECVIEWTPCKPPEAPGPPDPVSRCADCAGTGKITLLVTTSPCKTCSGTGDADANAGGSSSYTIFIDSAGPTPPADSEAGPLDDWEIEWTPDGEPDEQLIAGQLLPDNERPPGADANISFDANVLHEADKAAEHRSCYWCCGSGNVLRVVSAKPCECCGGSGKAGGKADAGS